MHDLQIDKSEWGPLQKISLFRENDFVVARDEVVVRLLEKLFEARPEVWGSLHQMECIDRMVDVSFEVAGAENI